MSFRFDVRAIWRAMTRNVLLKVFSTVFAIGLWGFVNLGARESERNLVLPIALRGLPPTVVITNSPPESVSVRLRGPQTILGTIDDATSISLDLANVRPGTTSIKIEADLLNLPRGVAVTRMSPVELTLEVERVVEKSMLVSVNLGGAVPAGFRLVENEARPPAVVVKGPASQVEALRRVATGPLHLSPVSGPFEELVPLERAAESLRLSPDRVSVRGRLEEVMVVQELRGIEIGVRNAKGRYRLAPKAADVTVRGPARAVRDLKLTPENLYIDVEGLTAGARTEKIQASLPQGVEVVEVKPAAGRVEVISERGPRRAR